MPAEITNTPKQKAEEKTDLLAGSLHSMFLNMPGLAFSKDAETGKYLACNQRFAAFANRKRIEDVAGLTDADLFDAETAAHFIADDRKALEMEEPYIFYEALMDAAGTPRHFQTTKLKFTDSNGRLCILGVCADVTELYTALTYVVFWLLYSLTLMPIIFLVRSTEESVQGSLLFKVAMVLSLPYFVMLIPAPFTAAFFTITNDTIF